MAELRPYNPTIRDRIASALMGQARPGSARANMVEGMMGSRGIGTTGMGLADLTPLGIPMAGQEAQRDAQSGNYIGAAANAMAVIPAAKAPVHGAKIGFEELLARAKNNLAARKAQAEELSQIGAPVRMENAMGHKALVQPDMSGSGGWRVTRFDDAGPMGHGEYKDAYAAIYEALQDGYAPQRAP